MLFNSIDFLMFFPVVLILYYAIPSRFRYLWLLAASYYFYMCWNAEYALLILFSTAVTYTGARLLANTGGGYFEKRKLIAGGSLALNLLVLFYFKYSNLAVYLCSDFFRALRIPVSIPVFDVLLPAGISFYTFQAIGYTIDVYRGDIHAEKNFFQYALFVSFFPQLVAGPIERSKNLLKQLAIPQRFSFTRAADGLWLMLWGFFLKMVLADRIAIFVNTVYADPVTYGGWYLVIATVLFAFQIYCDFYGYSVIAMGAAEMLGIQLMENFDAPYLSLSVSGFWRKWHISLTSWFKDYLYIPLGGSRKGKPRKYLNKLLVFLLSGFWHGSKISFAAWGLLNGFYQVAGEILQPLRDRAVKILHLNRESLGHKLAHMAGTFLLVDFSWIFFRADRFLEAFAIIKQMVTVKNPWILLDGSLYQCGLDSKNFWLMLICLCVLLAADYWKRKGIRVRKVIAAQDVWFRCLFFVFAVCVIAVAGIWGPGYEEADFIYFQF